jgi:hypothetical protein
MIRIISSYHIDQLGRVVELRAHSDARQERGKDGCKGCMYNEYRHCSDIDERPLRADGRRAICHGGIFVEVTHE